MDPARYERAILAVCTGLVAVMVVITFIIACSIVATLEDFKNRLIRIEQDTRVITANVVPKAKAIPKQPYRPLSDKRPVSGAVASDD